MSSLVSFNILSKKGTVLEVEVTIVHPDEHQINDDFGFAFQIVLEQFRNIEEGFIYNSNWQHYPFTEEEGKELITPAIREELSRLKELADGRKIPITKKEYKKINASDEWTYQGQKVSSMGSNGNNYYLSLDPEYGTFCKEVEQHIQSVEVLKHDNYPHWFDRLETWVEYQAFWGFPEGVYEANNDKPNPSYLLRITFESSELLEHMKEGSYWESAAFSFEGYYTPNYVPNYTRHKKLILDPAALEEVPSDDVLTNWWNNLSSKWKEVLQMNLYIQRRELGPNLIRNFLGMMISGRFKNVYGEPIFDEPDVQDLQNMVLMKAFFASGANLETLEPIKMLKGLQVVELEGNNIKDIDPLEGLKKLAYLNLYSCDKIEKGLSVLASLKNLQFIYYDLNAQADFDVLFSLPKLRKVHFFANFKLNGERLNELEKLEELGGYSEGITEQTLPIVKELHEKGVKIRWEIGDEGTLLELD